MSVAPELRKEQDYLAAARAALRAHARADPLAEGPGPRPDLGRAPRQDPAPAGSLAGRRPHDHPVLRPARHATRASAGTSGAGTSPTAAGDPVVIDWRAEMSTAFYRASRTEPDGRRAAPPVRLRPRARSPPTRTSTCSDRAEHEVRSQILAERDRAPPRRPDARHRRHHPARAGRDRPGRRGADDLRAGSAGHRQDRRRPAPRGLAALRLPRPAGARRASSSSDPTAPSSTTSAPCCPRSARSTVGHTTIEELVAGVPVRGTDATETAVLKGDARMAEVLHRAVWSRVRTADRGPRRAARLAQVARAGIRGQRDRRRARPARRPLRRRPADAAAAAGARGAPPDGAGGRQPRRPRAGQRGAGRSGQALRAVPVAGARPASGALRAAHRRRRPGSPRRRAPDG